MRLLLTLLLCIPFIVQAQYFEIGAFAGLSRYQGDLQSKLIETQDLNLAYGAVTRFNMNEYVSIKAQFSVAEISGDDKLAPENSGRQSRNLNFRSKLYEAAFTGEFNVIGYDVTQELMFSPYVFLGVSGFYHNPKAYYQDQFVELQPLGTEGQGMEAYPDRKKYSRFQVAIPAGVGLKWSVNDMVNIGLEGGIRKTFTDYLDDVSGYYPDIQGLLELDPVAATLSYRAEDIQNNPNFNNPEGGLRGNPNTKDWYFMGGLSVTINLGTYY